MAQWYSLSGNLDLKKGCGFKPTGVQVKALLATELGLGVPTACGSGLKKIFKKEKKK